MPVPVVARIAGNELTSPLRNYGHLVMHAARDARLRLDGRFVINRATGCPIGLAWARGLKQAVASGTPPELLLSVPALPAMLARARYLGALDDPQHRMDVRRLHAFAAGVEVVGRPLDTRLIVREDRRGRCFFDRIMLCGTSSLERQEDAADSRSRALRAVLAPPLRRLADGGGASAPTPPTALAGVDDHLDRPLPSGADMPISVGRAPRDLSNEGAAVRGAPPVAAPSGDQPSTLGYIGTSLLSGLAEGGKDLTAATQAEMGQLDELAETMAMPSGRETAQQWVYGRPVEPPNTAARYLGAVAEAAGENPFLAVVAPEATLGSALGSEVGSDANKAAGAPLPDGLVRFVVGGLGGASGVALAPRVRSWLGELPKKLFRPQPAPGGGDGFGGGASGDGIVGGLGQERVPGVLPEPQSPADAGTTASSPARPAGDDAAWVTAAPSKSGQIEYGSSNLSQGTLAYRQAENISPSRNVAAAEYEAADGSLQTVIVASERNVMHAERLLKQRLDEIAADPSRVRRIYSELQPCTLPGANCEAFIRRNFPEADVTWSFEYGASISSRRRGMAALKRAVRDADQYRFRLD